MPKKKEEVSTPVEAMEALVPVLEQGTTSVNPAEYLEKAADQARALEQVIKQSKKKVIIHGKQYLTFENWQMLGAFFGYTVSANRTAPIRVGEAQGWEAHAIVLDRNGMVVSEADSMCLNDESKWASSPQFHLRSMSQTRACAKALRNCCSHVVELAGYECTPAEEMDGVVVSSPQRQMPQRKAVEPAPPPCQGEPSVKPSEAAPVLDDDSFPFPEVEPVTPKLAAEILDAKIVRENVLYISDKQRRRLYAICKENNVDNAVAKKYLKENYNIDSASKIQKKHYEDIVWWAQRGNKDDIPI